MEKATKKKSTKAATSEAEIMAAYKDFLLKNGKRPATVYQFTADLNMKEEDFYKHFSSFEAVDKAIWSHFANSTIAAIKADKVYADYGARERVLAFFYTLIEILKKDRSYVTLTFKRSPKPEIVPAHLKDFKMAFDEFAKEIINDGVSSEEIVQRPVITERYHDGLWLQLLFVISFWLRDTSKNFERTDAAIEKSANLAFELMGRGPLDMIVDFGKFLYHNR